MTATIRVFAAVFITTVLAGAAGANDDLPPQGGPLSQGVLIGTPSKNPGPIADRNAYRAMVHNQLLIKIRGYEEQGGRERMRTAVPFTLHIDVAESGAVERVAVVSGPKDSAFQQLLTKVVGERLPPLPPKLGPSQRVELTLK